MSWYWVALIVVGWIICGLLSIYLLEKVWDEEFGDGIPVKFVILSGLGPIMLIAILFFLASTVELTIRIFTKEKKK